VLDGAGGVNTAGYTGSGVIASLANPASNAGADAIGDTYVNIQNLSGTSFTDTLTGDSQNNLLSGNGGNDLLIGGAGADTLDGGAGSDIFDFNALAESATSAPDLILSWSSGDKIDLSTIDADATVAGDQAFHLDGTSGGAADISYSYSSGQDVTVVNVWVDNDASIDMTIFIKGNVSLSNASFVF
jgi:Ca2+-binding RTX toxin-like protein